jgi:pimeloyl-ACP methyl ester carboxylesterase
MGLGTSRFWWPDGLADEFARRGFDVAAYDQRDAGESAYFPNERAGSPLKTLLRHPSPAYCAEDLADDAAVVLDALGWQRAHIFGHSMGGLIAQRVAIRHPDEGDPLLRVRAAHDVAAAIPGSKLRTFPGIGHLLTRESWPAYATAVRELADQAA